MRSLAIILLSLVGVAPVAQADPIDDYVRQQMAVSHVPGVAVAIVRNGQVESVRSYGEANLEWSSPVAPDTRFQIASATKLFTGVALMRLVEAGKLRLDDTLDRFFPEAPAEWRGIAVRQLANHSSGLSDRLPDHDDNVAGTVAAAMKAPLAYAPGSESRYGFTDFVVLRAVMEKVTGKTLVEIFNDEIIVPLKLQDTAFNDERQWGPVRSAIPLPHRASAYSWKDGVQRTSSFLYGETGYAAGGLYSSARDIAAMFAALDRGELLSAASMKALQTPPTLSTGRPGEFGVGWTTRKYHGVKVAGHSGGPALADILRAEGQGLTVIVLTNQQRFFPVLAEGVADFLLPPAPPLKPVTDRAPALTALMRSALDEAARGGKLDRSRYGRKGQRDVVPFLEDFGQALLLAVGPVKQVTLLSDRHEKGARTRRYAIDFERKRMMWLFEADADGRIEDLHPTSEE